jgi:hypothetical protein
MDMAKKPVTSQSDVRSSEGTLIFRGTVTQTKASSVPDIKADARTSIVRVDEVIAAPPTLARIAGREITVVLATGVTAVRTGEPAVFQASGLSFGDEIAVRATRADPITGLVRGGAPAHGDDIGPGLEARASHRDATTQLHDADSGSL